MALIRQLLRGGWPLNTRQRPSMYSDRRKIGTGTYVSIHGYYGGIRKHFDTYLNLPTE
jgi:hypothetical protein